MTLDDPEDGDPRRPQADENVVVGEFREEYLEREQRGVRTSQ